MLLSKIICQWLINECHFSVTSVCSLNTSLVSIHTVDVAFFNDLRDFYAWDSYCEGLYKLSLFVWLIKPLPHEHQPVKRKSVVRSLKEAENVTMTTDGRTSSSLSSYITITAHPIKSNWEMVTVVLQTMCQHQFNEFYSKSIVQNSDPLKPKFDRWGFPDGNLNIFFRLLLVNLRSYLVLWLFAPPISMHHYGTHLLFQHF